MAGVFTHRLGLNPAAGGGGPPITQNGAIAFNDTGPTVSASSPVPMPSEAYDNGGWHDLVTNTSRLTVPSGESLVRVNAAVVLNDNEDVGIYKNGTPFAGACRSRAATALTDSITLISPPLVVTPGDYFELFNLGASSEVFNAIACNVSIEALDPALQYCLVQKTAAQAAAAGNNTLTWDSEVADVGGWHDNVTNNSRLTVPTGVTLVRLCGSHNIASGAQTQVFAIMQKNGTNFVGMGQADQEWTTPSYHYCASAVLEVTPGDYFELVANVAASRTINNGDYTWFSIEEVDASIKRALVKNTAGVTLSASNDPIPWDGQQYDTDAIWDIAQPTRLVAPAGTTQARLSFGLIANTLSNAIAKVTRNGATEQTGDPGLPRSENDTFSQDLLNALGAWVPCDPGDYFEVRLEAASPVLSADAHRSWFCAEFK